MAKEKESVPDHIEWAMRTGPTPTNRCNTCTKFPKLLSVIEDIVKLQLEGKSSISRKQLHAYLEEKYNYTLHQSSLDRHVTECVLPKISGEKS